MNITVERLQQILLEHSQWANGTGGNRANLRGAYLEGAKNISAISLARTEIVPREGSFIGWKKCSQGVIVKLQIPDAAKRSNATGRKCRAEFVHVLDVIGSGHGISSYDGETIYRVGEVVNRLVECGGGIHFFLTEEEARDY